MQVSILGEKSRTLFVPTYIEYLRCEVTSLSAYNQECLKNNVEPVFDVYYDPSVGIGATTGMFVKGMKVTETPRRTEKQKAFLQEYAFIPYENKMKLEKDTASKLKKYEEVVSKLVKGYEEKVEKLEDVELKMRELKDKYNEKELHSVSNLLLDVLKSNYLIEEVEEKKEAEKTAETETDQKVAVDENNNESKVDENNNSKKAVKLDENNNEIVDETNEGEETKEVKKLELNETIKERQEELNHDLIFTHNYRQLLTNHIAIIMENLSTKQVRILEINYTASLLMDYLTYLVSAGSQCRTEYNLLHPMPALKSISSKYGINKVLELKPDNSISSEITASNIVVYKHWTTGYVNNLESLDLNYYKPKEEQEKELLKNTFEHLNNSGFLIFCYRTKLTTLEEELMKLGEQDTKVEMADRSKIVSWIKEAGFEYIGEEENENESGVSSILARKVCKDLVKVKKDEDESKKVEEKVDEKSDAEKPEEECEMENPLEPIPIEAKLFDYRWVVKVKKQLKTKSQKRIWLIARDSSINGIVGMMKCLKKEPEGERLRCLFNIDACKDDEFIEDKLKNGLLDPSLIDEEEEEAEREEAKAAAAKTEEGDVKKEEKADDKKPDNAETKDSNATENGEKKEEKTKEELEEEAILAEDENAEELLKLITKDLIEKDLTMNIIMDNKLGSYRQKKFEEELSIETEYAVLDILTRGDLSSFRWLKSNMKESCDYPALLYPLQTAYIKEERFKPFMVDIYYSALNFKDVMG